MLHSEPALIDARVKPRLRENVWFIDMAEGRALLLTADGRFDVPPEDALAFLKLRTHCTGHVEVAEIARRAAVSVDEVGAALSALAEIGVLYPARTTQAAPGADEVRTRLLGATLIWREELRCTTLVHSLVDGRARDEVLIGYLLEQYHLLTALPALVAAAAERADGALRAELARHAELRGAHAGLVRDALGRIGLSRPEVEHSAPLLSTRLLCFQLRELFELAPWSVFLAEAIRGGQTLDRAQTELLRARLGSNAALPATALEPWFAQQVLEAAVTNEELAAESSAHWTPLDGALLDRLCNCAHDLRHAFDLLGREVTDYHGVLNGKYVPHQPVDFASL